MNLANVKTDDDVACKNSIADVKPTHMHNVYIHRKINKL